MLTEVEIKERYEQGNNMQDAEKMFHDLELDEENLCRLSSGGTKEAYETCLKKFDEFFYLLRSNSTTND